VSGRRGPAANLVEVSHDRQNRGSPSVPSRSSGSVHKSNDRLDHDRDARVRLEVPIVVTSVGTHHEMITGVLRGIPGEGELVDRFAAEYDAARAALLRRVA